MIIEGIEIPSDDPAWMADLILQRTGPVFALDVDSPLGEMARHALGAWMARGDRTPLESLCRDISFVEYALRRVVNEAFQEAQEICSLSPRIRMGRLCSVGPGNGLVELFISRIVGVDQFLFIDIERTPEHKHDWANRGSGYASLQKLKDFVVKNGVSPEQVVCCNPRLTPLPTFEFDFLISVMSMGFHYPCDEYLDFMLENCSEQGAILFDHRINAPDMGFRKLASNPGRFCLEVVSENHKWQRILFSKPNRSSSG